MEPKRLFCRPGGIALTREAVLQCDFAVGAKILDVGCGTGESVHYLRRAFLFDAVGVDLDREIIEKNGEHFTVADASMLPMEDCMLDGILYECSFSKIEKPRAALREAHRVLKAQGCLIMSDFFSTTAPQTLSGVLGRMDPLESITEEIRSAGFRIQFVRDCSDCLAQLWGGLVLNLGRKKVIELLGIEESAVGSYGYFLLVGKKEVLK